MELTIYRLEQRRPGGNSWDEMMGVVVIASNTNKARKLAAGVAGDEGAKAWMEPTKTTCVSIGRSHEGVAQHVVLSDFKAG